MALPNLFGVLYEHEEIKRQKIWTNLHIACLTGSIGIAEFLIRQGVKNNDLDLEAKDTTGKTPLEYLTIKEHAEHLRSVVLRLRQLNLHSPIVFLGCVTRGSMD